MLSDFDLAKQSKEPAGLPGLVHSEQNGASGDDYAQSNRDSLIDSYRWLIR